MFSCVSYFYVLFWAHADVSPDFIEIENAMLCDDATWLTIHDSILRRTSPGEFRRTSVSIYMCSSMAKFAACTSRHAKKNDGDLATLAYAYLATLAYV